MKYEPKILEKIISFDFDGTLEDDFDGEQNLQKEEIQNICKKLISQGKYVCIITKRYGPDTGMGESDRVYALSNKLGIKDVYFTNRELKDAKVKELGIEVHFENNQYEADVIKFTNPSTQVICIEDPYWRDMVY